MGNPGKMLLSFFFLLTVVMHIVFSSDVRVIDTKKEAYNEAIRAASQLATLNIIDTANINNLYDGERKDEVDININFETLDLFRSTLDRLLNTGKVGVLESVSNINIPLVGFVTYDYIIGVTYGEASIDAVTLKSIGYTYDQYMNADTATRAAIEKKLRAITGQYLLPMGYTMYISSGVDSSISNRIWRFTLGDSIYIPNSTALTVYNGTTGEIDETRYIMSGTKIYAADSKGNMDTSKSYDLSGILNKAGFTSVEQLSEYVVMQSVNRYLNSYTGTAFNKTAYNTGSELEFDLDTVKHSKNKNDYSEQSGVIDGPGLFAVVDVYKGTGSNMHLYERIASFGGSELVPTITYSK